LPYTLSEKDLDIQNYLKAPQDYLKKFNLPNPSEDDMNPPDMR